MRVVFDPNEPEQIDLVGKVIAHLDRETQSLRDLIESLESVRVHVISRDLTALGEALAGHQQVQAMIDNIQQDRLALRGGLAKATGLPLDEVTIREFAELVDDKNRRELLTRREQLSQLVIRARQLSESNLMLVQHSMGLFQQLLQCLATDDAPASQYAASGQLSKRHDRTLFQTEC